MHCNSVMVYPQIIVTGDSIAQLSFQAGGYGSHLCDLVSGVFEFGIDVSTMARLMLSIAAWAVTIAANF